MKKQFIGTCVNNPFSSVDYLDQVVENARTISMKTFFKHCELEEIAKSDMVKYPYSYTFFKYKDIYFYTWSAIEHFYK